MFDPLKATTRIASSGLEAQGARMRVVAQNLANSRSTGATPGADPYTRKTVQIAGQFDRMVGAELVAVKAVGTDATPFRVEHDPGNPAADAEGNVKYPNVDMTVEMADMREASRSYSANLQMIKQARSLVAMTIDLLRAG
ncbi:flagellar basal body rod protein FlgC [Aquabacter spiritensis]|uniref:Flagellar basal-body rod protein FlgC n=1 Tax=Aquabacter spiritensis TaxID=933073 RepID=A0A4R3M5P9_9HYPH|nr:flagellar basal body rod protein FlgC [Aquabacter spiritensis]TCT07933.1 flagellar basal-body rod protein FlgC [Aquabacter spiritensis]